MTRMAWIEPLKTSAPSAAVEMSRRLFRLLTGFVTTLNLNSATMFRALWRINCDFKNSVLKCSRCSVRLHAFRKGNLTAELSITPLRPVHAFLAFLVLVLALTFQKDGVLRNINFHIFLC